MSSHEYTYPDVVNSSAETLTQSGSSGSTPEMQIHEREHDTENELAHTTTLVRHNQNFEPKQRTYLRNDLLLIVGYLEFFNALDFPANIWNTIPVPTFAIGLMATGGSVALIASTTAFIDLRRSWRNISALAAERLFLEKLRLSDSPSSVHQQYVQAWSSLNFREYGWELIDRSLMDALVGFAAVLVGVGTLMAIGGANPKVFLASNLLSGYIGNGFVALYSLVNAVWSGYLYIRARRHKRLLRSFVAEPEIRRRAVHTFRNHQLYAVLNGITLVVSGAASLLTAEFWWGYVMLIPCIAASVFCNILWRKKIGYNRTLKQFQSSNALEFDIYAAIRDAVGAQTRSAEASAAAQEKLEQLTPDQLITFMDTNGMLQDLCVHIANDSTLRKAAGIDATHLEITIGHQTLQALDHPVLLAAIQTVMDKVGATRLRDRERCLYELLGAHLHIMERSGAKSGQAQAMSTKTESDVEQCAEEPKT